MNTHQAAKTDSRAAEYLQDVSARRPQVAGDVVLLTLPMHHGAGPSALWGALRLGNRIVLLRRFDPATTLAIIDHHKVTAWTGVPTMYKRIAALPRQELDKYDVSSLRLLGVEGSAGTAGPQGVDRRLFRCGQAERGLRLDRNRHDHPSRARHASPEAGIERPAAQACRDPRSETMPATTRRRVKSARSGFARPPTSRSI